MGDWLEAAARVSESSPEGTRGSFLTSPSSAPVSTSKWPISRSWAAGA